MFVVVVNLLQVYNHNFVILFVTRSCFVNHAVNGDVSVRKDFENIDPNLSGDSSSAEPKVKKSRQRVTPAAAKKPPPPRGATDSMRARRRLDRAETVN